ncbi:hypothetical protein ROZALSC1DRAFT_29865 [Rozella allomycis CSF55]|uniref:Uncharacterized protein n=1 Tax=Rozella allomycis (strain CSF55) TaxID=988480 RepID=A0A4P9YJA7_ROZAC|nr:hypothetical protein ROZALSC1DRAFT_29865 [Rozella allomycis CSF55]
MARENIVRQQLLDAYKLRSSCDHVGCDCMDNENWDKMIQEDVLFRLATSFENYSLKQLIENLEYILSKKARLMIERIFSFAKSFDNNGHYLDERSKLIHESLFAVKDLEVFIDQYEICLADSNTEAWINCWPRSISLFGIDPYLHVEETKRSHTISDGTRASITVQGEPTD